MIFFIIILSTYHEYKYLLKYVENNIKFEVECTFDVFLMKCVDMKSIFTYHIKILRYIMAFMIKEHAILW